MRAKDARKIFDDAGISNVWNHAYDTMKIDDIRHDLDVRLELLDGLNFTDPAKILHLVKYRIAANQIIDGGKPLPKRK